MRGYQKVPYPLGSEEWESFKNFAVRQYKEGVELAVRTFEWLHVDFKLEPQEQIEVLKAVLDKALSPLVYLWEQWQLLTPPARLPYATPEYRQVLEKQIAEAKQIGEELASQIGTVMAPPQEKKEVSEG